MIKQILIMVVLIIGIIGAALLIISWIFETIESVREHKRLIDLRFAAIYLPAISFLVLYSWLIENAVFTWLNVILVIMVALEIWYTVHIKKVRRHKKHRF